MSNHTVPANFNTGRKRSLDSSRYVCVCLTFYVQLCNVSSAFPFVYVHISHHPIQFSPNTSRSHGNTTYHNQSNRQSYHGHNHHNHHYKRAKHHSGNNQTTLESIVDYIFGLPSLDHIVIEFRAGRKSPKGYASFITEEDFSSIYRYIRKSAKTSHHSEYIYERGRYLHSRLITDDSGMVTSGVYKERLASFDLATNLNHDIRVDILKETPIVPLPVCPEEGFMYERKKHRYTVETKDWHLDLMHVLTNNTCSPSDSHRPSASPDAEDDLSSPSSSTDSTTSYEIEAQIKLASMRNVPDKKAGVDLFENVFVEVSSPIGSRFILLDTLYSRLYSRLWGDIDGCWMLAVVEVVGI